MSSFFDYIGADMTNEGGNPGWPEELEDFCYEENMNEDNYWNSLFKHPHE